MSLLKVYGLTQLDAYRRDQEMENRLAEASEEELLQQVEISDGQLVEQQAETHYLHLVGESTAVPSKEDELPMVSKPVDVSAHLDVGESAVSSPQSASVACINSHTSSDVKSSPGSETLMSTSTTAGKTTSDSRSQLTDDRSVIQSLPTSHAVTPSLSSAANHLSTSLVSSANIDRPLSSTAASLPKYLPSDLAASSTAIDTLVAAPESSSGQEKSTSTLALTAMQTSLASKQTQSAPLTQLSTPTVTLVPRSPAVSATSSTNVLNATSSPVPSPSRTSFSNATSLSYRSAASTPSYSQPQQRRNDSRPAHPAQHQVLYTHSHASHPQPNESIYGTIMKRLLSLEVNATLSTAYIEEHTKFVWETFRRIEDRLGGIEKSVSCEPHKILSGCVDVCTKKRDINRINYSDVSCWTWTHTARGWKRNELS